MSKMRNAGSGLWPPFSKEKKERKKQGEERHGFKDTKDKGYPEEVLSEEPRYRALRILSIPGAGHLGQSHRDRPQLQGNWAESPSTSIHTAEL